MAVRDEQRADAAPAHEQESKQWQWTKCWYPVQSMEALDPKIPQHVSM